MATGFIQMVTELNLTFSKVDDSKDTDNIVHHAHIKEQNFELCVLQDIP